MTPKSNLAECLPPRVADSDLNRSGGSINQSPVPFAPSFLYARSSSALFTSPANREFAFCVLLSTISICRVLSRLVCSHHLPACPPYTTTSTLKLKLY